MLTWPTDHAGTIGWPLRRNFPKVVFAGTMLTPEASDGPSAVCNVWNNWCKQDKVHGQDVRCGSASQNV